MSWQVGSAVAGSRWRLWSANLLALALVAADFWLSHDRAGYPARAWLIAGGLPVLLLLHRGRLASLGLRLPAGPSWRYWLVITPLIGLAVALFAALVATVWLLLGLPLPTPQLRPDVFWQAVFSGCLLAPLVEETIYRVVLLGSLTPVARRRYVIAWSGVVFAILHVVYNNPGADNAIAGFFFGWAYLRSGTVLVPMFLHALGNLAAFSIHLAAYYWLHIHVPLL